MAYATQSDIESEFKNLTFTATTLVTDSDVAAFITQADALINSYLGMRYMVPITADASALALLQLYCVTLVADRIKKILEVKQSTNSEANQATRGAFTTKNVMDALNDLKSGKTFLSGATSLVDGGAFYSSNAANSIEPEFKKEEKQW